MTEMRGYAAAQREYDNRTPPDDGPCECPDCKGGYRYTTDTAENEHEIKCESCDGFGYITSDGEPFDPHKKERDESDYADWKRDEERSREDRHE